MRTASLLSTHFSESSLIESLHFNLSIIAKDSWSGSSPHFYSEFQLPSWYWYWCLISTIKCILIKLLVFSCNSIWSHIFFPTRMNHSITLLIVEAKYVGIIFIYFAHSPSSSPSTFKGRQKSSHFLPIFPTIPLARATIRFYLDFWNDLLSFSLVLLQLSLCSLQSEDVLRHTSQTGLCLFSKPNRCFSQQLKSKAKVILSFTKLTEPCL